MAFKIEKTSFDWDLEVPIISEDGTEKTEIIRCNKPINTKTYSEFTKHLNKTYNNNKDENVELDNALDTVISQIDYLYGKGLTWWKENVSPDVIIRVQRHILDFTNELTQKKSS